MALPTRTQIVTMDYAFNGEPFVQVAAKSGIDLDGIDYAYQAEPFWGLEVAASGAYTLTCDAGAFTLTGQDAAFTYTPAPAAPGGGGGWYTEPPQVQKLKRKRRKDREPIPLTEKNIPKIARQAEEDIGAMVMAYLYWDDD